MAKSMHGYAKRARYKAFEDNEYNKIGNDFEFWNAVLKPSDEVNQFLIEAFQELKASELPATDA